MTRVVAPSAVGSLTPEYGPGTLGIPDQIVDRTYGRSQTFYDTGGAVHVSFADPYCPVGRQVALETGGVKGWPPIDGGTLVIIEGPRFSTRAESQWYTDQGWHVIGMTQMPEAALAAELGVPFAGIALVTDYDAGLAGAPGTEPVTMEEVFAMVERNAERVRGVLFRAVEMLDDSILTSVP